MQQGYRKFLIQWRSYQVGELIFPWFFSSIFFLNIPLVEVLYAFCVCIWVEVERKLFLCSKIIESSWYNEEVSKLESWFFSLILFLSISLVEILYAFCVCIWVEVERKLFLCNKVIESSWYNEEVNKLGSWFFLDSLPQYPFSGSIVAFCVCIWVEVEKKLFLCNKVIESF